VSTLDWIAHVTRRPEPARLMLLATFRPTDAAAVKAGLGPIVAELALHGRCHEIALSPLNLQAIEAYLQARLGDADGTAQLREIAPVLLKRTGGNPLFMTSIVNHLAQRNALACAPAAIAAIPDDVRRFIERQIDELDENCRNLLAAASVISREFATTAVAAALEANVEQVEVACDRLARQGVFIVKAGSAAWPDGTQADLYAFRHDLYRELLYDRLPPTRRALSHARVGCRLEAAWAGRLEAVAVELAEHFERGNELARAIPHHQRAATRALRRGANHQALGHLRRALDVVGHIPDGVERTKVEIALHVGIGAVYIATHGYGAPEVFASYARAQALGDSLGGEPADIFPALWGQWMFHSGRCEYESAWRLCKRLMALAEKSSDAGLRLQAHHATWNISFMRGELAETCAHAQAGLALYDAETHRAMASSYGNHDAGACARNFTVWALALAGEEERARAMADNALAIAKNLNDPFSLAVTLYFLSAMAQVLGDVALAAEHSEACIRVATEHEFPPYRAWGAGVAGWCIAKIGDADRGIAWLIDAIAALRAMQTISFIPYLLGLLADAHADVGHHDEAMKAVQEGIAMAEAFGERTHLAELYRLQGELCAHPAVGQKQKAEESLRLAIKIAKQQGAAALERKANESLRRCFAQRSRPASPSFTPSCPRNVSRFIVALPLRKRPSGPA
jgi:tetratricopeptide (TPR) repeat protein